VVALVEQQHLGAREAREPLGEHRAREAGADHDDIVRVLEHLARPGAVLAVVQHARPPPPVDRARRLDLLVARVPRGEPVGGRLRRIVADVVEAARRAGLGVLRERAAARLEHEEDHQESREQHDRALRREQVRHAHCLAAEPNCSTNLVCRDVGSGSK
jgi:hypothetical protein